VSPSVRLILNVFLRPQDRKELYATLEISDALAVELTSQAPEALTIREYVALKAHNLVSGVKTELERTRRELQRTQEQVL
jgi:hypothetical protein